MSNLSFAAYSAKFASHFITVMLFSCLPTQGRRNQILVEKHCYEKEKVPEKAKHA